jgi:hypothetical protein
MSDASATSLIVGGLLLVVLYWAGIKIADKLAAKSAARMQRRFKGED